MTKGEWVRTLEAKRAELLSRVETLSGPAPVRRGMSERRRRAADEERTAERVRALADLRAVERWLLDCRADPDGGAPLAELEQRLGAVAAEIEAVYQERDSVTAERDGLERELLRARAALALAVSDRSEAIMGGLSPPSMADQEAEVARLVELRNGCNRRLAELAGTLRSLHVRRARLGGVWRGLAEADGGGGLAEGS